eukprot:Seg298.14 transcript_id=Seg298.14/GoldUCD/mRNA.D3Y31 product="Choline/ethanolaminephosphotransferase 1" protein_id=Seg298.14/GoldUCD/D3Y31
MVAAVFDGVSDEAPSLYSRKLVLRDVAVLVANNIEFTSYVCAVGFLIWLHADNLDGTLARIRKTPSQFGEILDHGGDAIGVMIASLAIACMLGVNHSSFGMLMWCLSDFVVNYISEPYMTYLKGKMHFESIDFAEIMIIYASISFITAFYGLDMWSRVIIQAINFQPRYIIFVCKIFIPISLVFGKTPTLLQAATEKKMSLIDALLPSVSPIIAVISALMAHTFASEAFMQRHLILFILPFGFTIVKLHYQLLVLHMTNMNNATIDHCVLFPMAMAFGMFYCSTVEAETLVMILVLEPTPTQSQSPHWRRYKEV